MKELNSDFICDHMLGTAIIDGKMVYWTEDRLNSADVPEGYKKYEVRGTDSDWTEWSTLEEKVGVNFAATILTEEEFPLTAQPWFNPYTGSEGVDHYYEIKDYTLLEDEDDILEMWDGGYGPEDLDGYEVVTWPESQDLMEHPNMRAFCYLINDEEGLNLFGSSAYVVVSDWYNSLE